jgi:hypothetical protein
VLADTPGLAESREGDSTRIQLSTPSTPRMWQFDAPAIVDQAGLVFAALQTWSFWTCARNGEVETMPRREVARQEIKEGLKVVL